VSLPDLIGLSASLLLTLMVFSYLLGENPLSRPLYRIALHLFIGASAGYVLAVALRQVIWPRLGQPFLAAGVFSPPIFPIIPLVLGLLLLMKTLRSPIGQWGNLSVAFLVGAGAAVAVGGAVTGTLFPQARAAAAVGSFPLDDLPKLFGPEASAQFERLAGAAVFFVGTLTTLMYFFFTARREPGTGALQRHPIMAGVAFFGQVFINVTYGALYAGALAASLAVLTDRVAFVWEAIGKLGLR
jgi:hypothetical protein